MVGVGVKVVSCTVFHSKKYKCVEKNFEFSNTVDIQHLVNLGSEVNSSNHVGKSVLHYATEEGNLEVVKLLLSLGADPNIKDTYNISSLQYSIFSKKLEVVKEICNSSRTLMDEIDHEGNSVLHFAAYSGNLKIVFTLFHHLTILSTLIVLCSLKLIFFYA